MKIKLLLFFLILMFSKIPSFAQASWSYTIWFNLVDESGKIMTKREVVKNKIQILTVGPGHHTDNKLTYDNTANAFKFSQHTVTTSSLLVFIHEKDTTTIELETTTMYLDKISLQDGFYSIRVWNNEANFICDRPLSKRTNGAVCKNKYPFSYYEIEKKKLLSFYKLVEVKLK